VVNSPYFKELLIAQGWSRQMISCGGSLRYVPLVNSQKKLQCFPKGRGGRLPTLYVPLAGEKRLALCLAELLRQRCRFVQRKIKILVKYHPSVILGEQYFFGISQIEVTNSQVDGLAESIDAVLYSSTTVGLEALLLGLPVFRYLPEGILTLDPVPTHLSAHQKVCDSGTLLEFLQTFPSRDCELKPLASRDLLYHPIDREAWMRALTRR
jgi:hypothetical protein